PPPPPPPAAVTPPPPPPATPPPPAPDSTKPALGSLRASPAAFVAATSGASVTTRTARSTRLSFRLSEAARVTFTLQRRAAGRLAGGRCRTATPANRSRPRCDLALRGSF